MNGGFVYVVEKWGVPDYHFVGGRGFPKNLVYQNLVHLRERLEEYCRQYCPAKKLEVITRLPHDDIARLVDWEQDFGGAPTAYRTAGRVEATINGNRLTYRLLDKEERKVLNIPESPKKSLLRKLNKPEPAETK